MLNHLEAKNEVRRAFRIAWNAGIASGFTNIPPVVFAKVGSATPYVPEIRWHGVEKSDDIDNGVHWCRFSSQSIQTKQSVISRRIRTTSLGLVIVQIFYSKSAFKTEDELLGLIGQNAFIGHKTPGGVWFRESTLIDLDPEENHFRANVVAEYEYDSLKV